MRRFLPLLLLGLAGCYSPRTLGPATGADGYSPAQYGGGWFQEPLRASIYFNELDGYASFDLNRPAHVAIFALQPGGSLRMVYPAIGFGGRQEFAGGNHWVPTAASSYRFASNYSLAWGATPTYMILVASERPLDVRSYMATGGVPWMNRMAATWNPYTATELLASQIVPQPSVTDWTVAYHVVWPNSTWDSPNYRPRYTWVVCPGDLVLSVPLEAYRRGLVQCPTGQPIPGDSADIPLPKIGERIARRTPPPGWMEPGETDDVKMGEMLRRVGERRGIPVADSAARGVPAWRRVTRPAPEGVEAVPPRRQEARPVVPTSRREGPTLRPERRERVGEPERREGSQQVERARGPEGRPAIPVRTPPRPETRRVAPRPQPEATTPAPRVERVQRPARAEPRQRAEPRARPARERVERPARPTPTPTPAPAVKSPAPQSSKAKPRPKPKEGGGGPGA